ncbi:MAG: hypothetical protein ABH804_01805 [archaeon]
MTWFIQIAIDLGLHVVQDYKEFRIIEKTLKEIGNAPTEIPRFAGRYNARTHLFYGFYSEEEAEEFAQKARDTGLVNAVYIDPVL